MGSLFDVGWVVLLFVAAVAIRQDSAVFRVPAVAAVVLFVGYQVRAKVTHRPTSFHSANGHVGFCLTAAVMVYGGGLHLVDPQPNTSDVARVLGGFTCLAGLAVWSPPSAISGTTEIRPSRPTLSSRD